MDNTTELEVVLNDGTKIVFVIIDHGNNEMTCMTKAEYERRLNPTI